uniref:(+)-delta-cadinene synthase isozyme C2 n=1 Tax=Cajanus cajan TaxID=3821 RepID=A0A151UDR3_CAJCA
MSIAASALVSTQNAVSDVKRPCANFAPSIWGNTFLQYASESMCCTSLLTNITESAMNLVQDVFNKFKNEQGNFNETLANDIQGLCSLYEATHLRQPLNKSVLRFEARYHMTVYEQDSSHNEILLTFTKVDFNILQKMHQKESGIITKWWKQSNVMKKVPHARDRLVECYLWILAMSYKPEDSNGRMFAGKLSTVITLLDDAYDAYGTVEELELLTEAFKRWDISLIGSLPVSMKVIFDTIVELSKEMELLTAHTGKSSLAICNLAKAYMVEAKWCHKGYIPTYDEYKANGILTSCCPLLFTSMICLGEFATEDVLDWIFSDPKILQASSIIGRVMDDMASHKFEQQRVHVASSVECCMNQYGISEIEAYKLIRKDIEDYWKVINEEYFNSYNIPKSVLDCVANFARMSEFSYENRQDKFTNGELLKDDVSSLLLNPICLEECK